MTFTNWLKKELINYDIRRYPVAVVILCQNNKITLPRKKVGPGRQPYVLGYLHSFSPMSILHM